MKGKKKIHEKILGKIAGYCPCCHIMVSKKELNKTCSKCGKMLIEEQVKNTDPIKARSIQTDKQGMDAKFSHGLRQMCR